ncbi:MAG: glycosyltransferase family 4 protein [Proteobacteria bacterium]|nr:glycosyltransferase family 4 protein [Pseudomonadota bacterium]
MPHIAFIASFPPPVCGQSLAADLLRTGLRKAGIEFRELDLAEPIQGYSAFKRICQLACLEGRLIALCIRDRDLVVYLQLGHGKSALIRDLFFMMTAMGFRKPCVAHVHGSGFRNALEQLPLPVRALEKKLIRHLKAAVVLSESLREMFKGLVDDEHIFAVDNGIDQSFVDLTSERTFEADQFRVLFLSNFLTAKGFSVLLKTAVMAKKAGKSWQFIFVGAKIPGQDVELDAFIQDYELDNVKVHGVVEGEEKHIAYQNADIFVLPSEYEGQPLCLLEAMFESLPVITTRVGGIPEIFSDDTGVRYVEPRSTEQLFEALEDIAQNPELRMKMGNANRKLALARFTAQKHIESMIDILYKASL